jgi:hypothetical protein
LPFASRTALAGEPITDAVAARLFGPPPASVEMVCACRLAASMKVTSKNVDNLEPNLQIGTMKTLLKSKPTKI